MSLLLPLLLLSSRLCVASAQSIECPALCTCDTLEREVDCSGLGLTAPPTFTLPQPNLRRLLIDNNRLGGVLLMGPLLAKLPDLEELSMTNNQLVGLNFDGLAAGGTLERLWLGSNGIGELSELTNLRLVLPSLRELSLVKNELLVGNLAYLSREALSCEGEGPPLEVLDLSGNKMSGLSPSVGGEGGQVPLPSLHQLHLNHNQLTSLTPNLTALAPALSEILINNNQLEEVGPDSVSGLAQLSLLDLRENEDLLCSALTHLPHHAPLTVLYHFCTGEDGALSYPPGASTPLPTTSQPTECLNQPGYFPPSTSRYMSGTLLDIIHGVSGAVPCQHFCDYYSVDQPCGGYSYSASTRHCYIWAVGARLGSSSAYMTSAVRGVFDRYWFTELDRGSLLYNTPGSGSFDECEAQCLRFEECEAYSWHVEGRCYLYQGYITFSNKFSKWNTGYRN